MHEPIFIGCITSASQFGSLAHCRLLSGGRNLDRGPLRGVRRGLLRQLRVGASAPAGGEAFSTQQPKGDRCPLGHTYAASGWSQEKG